MKLITMTQVTVDGVMQGNGGASEEDRTNGFQRGGWAFGLGLPEAGPDIAVDLVESRADSKGVTIQVYRPVGRPHYAN